MTTCPTSLSTAPRAADPTPISAARTRSPAMTRSSCRPTARVGCSRRRVWSTVRCPRTTSRRSRRWPTRCTRSSRARRGSFSRARTTSARRVPVDPGVDVYPYVFTTYRLTEHHTAGGMSRWLPYLVRAATRDVLRGLPGTGRRTRTRAVRLGHHHLAPRGDRGQGAGHRADDAAGDRRPHRAPDRAALPLGRRRGRRGQRRRGQRSARGDPGPERADPGVARSASCDIQSGPPTRGARTCCGWSRSTRAARARRPRPATGSPTPPGRLDRHRATITREG